jgi:hypothetical protein
MAEVVKPRLDAEPEPEQKRFARPTRSPELLADLVSGLTHQQKAEMTYELVLFAALAAEDTGHADLNEFLAELEDMASVYTDPERRRELQNTTREPVPERIPAATPAS